MKPFRKSRRGQTLPLLALMVFVLFMFVGLGIDVSFAYLTRAALSKAVDAACMMGIRNVSGGQPAALQLARSTFDMNYASSGVAGRATATPTVNSVFSTTANGNVQLDVSASVPIRTFFLRVLPAWRTMTVGAQGQARRAKVVMSLVLDRSGSMNGNGGGAALPGAVATFIGQFDETVDRAGMSSFASHATFNVNPIGTPFKAAISNAANAMAYTGATFSPGGLTNGLQQILAVPVAAGEDVVKVCVFFTDGFANTIQDTVNCPAATQYNFGGNAPSEGSGVWFMSPSTGAILCQATGTPLRPSGCGCSATTFVSAIDGTAKNFTALNIATESEYRSVQIANTMRANGIIVYSIGLGNNINPTFIRRVANDPATPGYTATFYDGEALFAPSAAQLQQVFEVLANKIILRLTQ